MEEDKNIIKYSRKKRREEKVGKREITKEKGISASGKVVKKKKGTFYRKLIKELN
jgi:hypothetical protein